ncbi:hypothetical protein AKO1_005894 [Acrasis kona]|uniref:Uncharacterized protein n=1 Tax=Acrasis kona TaxID=1008807 RepID=A0AAW2YK31_9EUKA
MDDNVEGELSYEFGEEENSLNTTSGPYLSAPSKKIEPVVAADMSQYRNFEESIKEVLVRTPIKRSLENLTFYFEIDVLKYLRNIIITFGGRVIGAEQFNRVMGPNGRQDAIKISDKRDGYHHDLIAYLTRGGDKQNLPYFRNDRYNFSKPFSLWDVEDLKYRDIHIREVDARYFNNAYYMKGSDFVQKDRHNVEKMLDSIVLEYNRIVNKGHHHHGQQTHQETQHRRYSEVLIDVTQELFQIRYPKQKIRSYYEASVTYPEDRTFGHGYVDMVLGIQDEEESINRPNPILFVLESKSHLSKEKTKHQAQTVAEMMAASAANHKSFPNHAVPCHAMLSDGLNCRLFMMQQVTEYTIFIGMTKIINIGNFIRNNEDDLVFKPSDSLKNIVIMLKVLTDSSTFDKQPSQLYLEEQARREMEQSRREIELKAMLKEKDREIIQIKHQMAEARREMEQSRREIELEAKLKEKDREIIQIKHQTAEELRNQVAEELRNQMAEVRKQMMEEHRKQMELEAKLKEKDREMTQMRTQMAEHQQQIQVRTNGQVEVALLAFLDGFYRSSYDLLHKYLDKTRLVSINGNTFTGANIIPAVIEFRRGCNISEVPSSGLDEIDGGYKSFFRAKIGERGVLHEECYLKIDGCFPYMPYIMYYSIVTTN